jgi:DNA-binding transcriptional LysR family regulator
MLNLHLLRTFCAVAAAHSFTRAAAQFGYSQPNVTAHIKMPESELGVRIFERCRFSRTVLMTDAGRCTLEYARRLFTLAEEIKAAAAEAEAAISQSR